MKISNLAVPVYLLLACVTFTSCSNFGEVKEKIPLFRPATATAGAPGVVETRIEGGLKKSQREPMAALADYLAAAQAATGQLRINPKDETARQDYNFAVSRVFTVIRDAKLNPWTSPLTVPAEGGSFVLTNRPDSRKAWNPALYDFTPADQFEVGGSYVNERSIKEGLGAPLVAVGREANTDIAKDFTLPRVYYGVTAVARFSGNRCEISFEDPLATETVSVSVSGRTYPMAADYTVPLAVMLASTKPEKLGIARLLNPEKYAATARIARLQPFDPNKTVVLVIHGLNSVPATYTPLINTLRVDETIRRNYQFWFYSYPSGYPYPHSAAILRKELDAVAKRYPMKKKMVVIGHSMGGCISRLLITDVGDDLWLKAFGKPPAEVEMTKESKAMFSDALIFNHRPEVGRVIFIAAPLRGADMASGWMGRLGSKLVKAPFKLAGAGVEALRTVTFRAGEQQLKGIPNSVDTLATNNRFVKNINTFPLTPGIPYNCIMGDRGKGGNKDQTKPCSSDGLVPYWSSHLDGAESELIVPSGHGAHQNPEAIAEVRRILRLHAGR